MSQFHAHLDECAQCREQPFNLCERGAELLRRAVLVENVERVFRVGPNEMFPLHPAAARPAPGEPTNG